jgi:hypothetical protein
MDTVRFTLTRPNVEERRTYTIRVIRAYDDAETSGAGCVIVTEEDS